MLNIFARGVEPSLPQEADGVGEGQETLQEGTSTNDSITSSPETIERSSHNLITS